MNTAMEPKRSSIVLVVDDDAVMRHQLRTGLEYDGYQVMEAASGADALDKYRQMQPDMVLLDVLMQPMDGFDCCTRLKTMPNSDHTPILMMTILDDDDSVELAFAAGADDYITKPIHWAILRQRIRRMIQMSHLIQSLKVSNQELEAFSYSVSHDLRSPLTNIRGFSQLLLDTQADHLDAKGNDYLRIIQEIVQQMTDTINHLLLLSQVGRADIVWDTVNLSQIAAKILRQLQQAEPNRQVEQVIALDLCVNGDRHLLQIALQNLLGNAWKYTGDRSPTHIEVGTTEVGNHTVYFVRDNGAGFDMKHAHRLFKAFQRLHSQSEFPGTGIGLTTVQRIIHRHGGKIWADSAVGEGTTFYFTLMPSK